MNSIRHCGIVVDNLDKMTEFYKILGFEEHIKAEYRSELIDNLLGFNRNDLEVVKLKSNNTIIELLKFNNIDYPRDKTELYQQGISHIAINVRDIDNIYYILSLKGIKFNSPPLLTDDNVKVCFCRDIEDNFLELVEEL